MGRKTATVDEDVESVIDAKEAEGETELEDEDLSEDYLRKPDADFQQQFAEGAVEGVERPKADLQAVDWSERIGKCVKQSIEVQPNAERIEIKHVQPSPNGAYYEVTIYHPRTRQTATGTLQTEEFLFLYNHSPRRLGKWLRRFANALIGRPLAS